MFHAVVEIGTLLAELVPGLGFDLQESKFASERSRLLGFVFCAAGPVTPRTFEVVIT